MRTTLIYGCLGLASISSLAGCGLFSNCRDDSCCNSRPTSRMVVRNGVVVAQNPSGTTATTTISGSSRPIAAPAEPIVVGDPVKQLPAPDKLVPIPIPTLPAAPEPAPAMVETAAKSDAGAVPREVADVMDLLAASRPEIATSEPAGKEKSVALKSLPVQNGHSEDFKTVTGQVQMWRSTVRLRYAPIDQEDQYGGFIVLEGDAELTKLRDGQHVRIRGVLIAPENRNDDAHYRVQGLDMLD